MPRCLRPQAASRPSKPPPITTARLCVRGGRQHLVDIGDVAEGANARQAKARNRRRQRSRAGGDQEPVVTHGDAARRGDGLALRDQCAVTASPVISVMPIFVVPFAAY